MTYIKDTAFIVAAFAVVGMAMLAALVVPPFVIVSCINALAELGGSGFYLDHSLGAYLFIYVILTSISLVLSRMFGDEL